ncbi:Alpha/beta hydrolase fold-1 [Aspergillus floccosus]
MAKPTILFVPGSLTVPELYTSILDPVAEAGYEVKALHLPSVGHTSGQGGACPPPSMYDDAAFIASQVRDLVDEGKDVIIFAHAYGGIPATESTKGLSKHERQQQGKPGGVVRLAYIAALVPDLGENAMGLSARYQDERNQAEMKHDENGWIGPVDIAASAKVVFSSLPLEKGIAWIQRLPRHSAASLMGVLTHPGYIDVPVSYLICEDDLVLPEKGQRHGIDVAKRESGRDVDVMSIRSDHCPMASAPQDVVRWMKDVLRKN